MEKHNSCVITLGIVQYVQEKATDRLPELFENLGPEMEGVSDPKSFLSDPNNWVSSSLLIRLYENVKQIFLDEDVPFKIGYESVFRQRLGYIQKIMINAFGNPARGLRHSQKINDQLNRTKSVEVIETGRCSAIVRLLWVKGIPLSRDFCLTNKGIYTAIPVIWGLPPSELLETKCFFRGDDVCEYRLRWQQRRVWNELYNRLILHRRVALASIQELERDKEILREKCDQINGLNFTLQRKLDQLLSLQEASTAILSTLDLDDLLDLVLNRLLKVAHLTRAGIFLVNQSAKTLRLIHAVGVEAAEFDALKGYEVPLAKLDNLIARTAREQEPVFVEDVEAAAVNPNNPLLQMFRPKAFILVPLTARGQAVGILVGDHNGRQDFLKEIDREFLTSFANQIAMALEHAALYQQLEASERKYREMVENAHEGIWVLDGDGNIGFANRRLIEMLGCEDLQGRNVYSVVAEDGKKALLRLLLQNMKGTASKEEVQFRGSDGRTIYTLLSSVPMETGGQYSGSLAMLTDLTEQKAMEAKLLRSQKLESIGTMAGGIAHDFNNILTGIMGYTELLKEKLSAEPTLGRYTDVISQSSLRAANLVKQLLAFSRGAQPGVSVPIQAIQVNDVVRETVRLLESSLDKNIEISLSLEADPPLIRGDPTQVQQALLNVCLNARDAMPDGGRLSLTTCVLDTRGPSPALSFPEAKPGRYVRISVSDTGTGIRPQDKERIFDPFFTTKEVGKGTGLGLAMVYGIMRNGGGWVHVESDVGKGSTFELFFPLADLEAREGVPDAESSASRGSETVLVVDDEEVVRDLAREILSDEGYRVLTAKDGLEAVHTYKALGEGVDLVILDLVMPRMDGIAAYKRLKEIDPRVKILFCSGYDSDHQGVEALRQEGRVLISKPFHVKTLANEVRNALDKGL